MTKDNLQVGEFKARAKTSVASVKNFVNNEIVFNSWGRFSHQADTEAQPASIIDVESWIYDSSDDTLLTAVNSRSVIGFYSAFEYDSYLFSTQLKSDSPDDDTIGILLAFHVDENGREHTLSALRSPGGSGYSWRIMYNYGRSDARVVKDCSEGVTWGDKEESSYVADSGHGWACYPQGVWVRAVRKDDVITVETTQFGDTKKNYTAKMVIDLSDDPRLFRFRGAKPYGFICRSQPRATWKNTYFLGTKSSYKPKLKDAMKFEEGVRIEANNSHTYKLSDIFGDIPLDDISIHVRIYDNEKGSPTFGTFIDSEDVTIRVSNRLVILKNTLNKPIAAHVTIQA